MYDPLLTVPVLTVPVLSVPVLTVPVLTVPVLTVPVLTVPVLSGHRVFAVRRNFPADVPLAGQTVVSSTR
jgi:hypothetical protein